MHGWWFESTRSHVFDRSYNRRVEDCEEKLEERANPRSHAWKGRFRRRLGKPVETVETRERIKMKASWYWLRTVPESEEIAFNRART